MLNVVLEIFQRLMRNFNVITQIHMLRRVVSFKLNQLYSSGMYFWTVEQKVACRYFCSKFTKVIYL